MTTATTFTIGGLAAAAGVGVETIRYYQRQGLLPEPPRPAQGYRRYDAGLLTRLQFIRRAKQLGFTLREIRELLSLGDGNDSGNGDGGCAQAQRLALLKAAEIQRRIDELSAMLSALKRLSAHCDVDRQRAAHCHLLEALQRG